MQVTVNGPLKHIYFDKVATEVQRLCSGQAPGISRAELEAVLQNTLKQITTSAVASCPSEKALTKYDTTYDRTLIVRKGSKSLSTKPKLRLQTRASSHREISVYVGKLLLSIKFYETVGEEEVGQAGKAIINLRIIPSLWLVKLGISWAFDVAISNLSTPG